MKNKTPALFTMADTMSKKELKKFKTAQIIKQEKSEKLSKDLHQAQVAMAMGFYHLL